HLVFVQIAFRCAEYLLGGRIFCHLFLSVLLHGLVSVMCGTEVLEVVCGSVASFCIRVFMVILESALACASSAGDGIDVLAPVAGSFADFLSRAGRYMS